MKKVLLTLLAIIVIVGALGGAGFAGYQIGLRQGRQATLAARPNNNNNNQQPSTRGIAPMMPGNNFGFGHMPNFGRGMERNFQRGFGPGGFGFGMMPMGRGFGFFGIFGLLGLLIRLAIFGFIIWVIYKLLTGWRFSFAPRTVEAPKAEASQPVPPAESETASETKNE
jgi:hypothetical protein